MESAAKDYCQYFQTDSTAEVSALEETIENMLMRLEEYKGTVEMIKSERIDLESIFKEIFAMEKSFLVLTNKIDAMEVFISKVHQDMNTLETQIIEAEQDYPDRPDTTLRNFLKPIFSKINPEFSDNDSSMSAMSRSTMSSFEKMKIFSTDELFKKS